MVSIITPHPCLDKIVDYYWIEKSGANNIKVLPDGAVSVIFNLGSPLSILDAKGNSKEFYDNLLVGTQKRYFVLNEKKGTHFIGIKFKQGGAYHLFKSSMQKFTNKILDLDKILYDESEQLRNMLVGAENTDDIKRILNYYLFIKADMLSGRSETVDFAIDKVKIELKKTPELIKDLCLEVNVSNKHLISLFNEKVGLPPKVIHRINKFNKVIEIIQKKEKVNWSQVAYECQYYDQSHMINDFKYFTGVSPKTYLSSNKAIGLRVETD